MEKEPRWLVYHLYHDLSPVLCPYHNLCPYLDVGHHRNFGDDVYRPHPDIDSGDRLVVYLYHLGLSTGHGIYLCHRPDVDLFLFLCLDLDRLPGRGGVDDGHRLDDVSGNCLHLRTCIHDDDGHLLLLFLTALKAYLGTLSETVEMSFLC